MAINLKFDLFGNPEPPSIVLANRNGNKLGQLDVDVDSIEVSDKFNDISEFSFTLNKYIDGKLTPLWNKVVDFKLVYCPEWDIWFEIKVELDEATETIKTVFCIQLGQAELSQIMLFNVEINTEADIEREDYKTSILYDEKNTESSILHRLLEKAPHYSIAYVDESIQRIQRQFSFDGTSIYDAFNEIAEEIGCLFVYNSNTQAGGKPNRTISVYDLQQNCNNKNCKHRGEFTDKCPKCGSTDITYGYGEDTTIFVTSDELATEGIQLVTDTDSVKNCFKLEAGDDLMTATIRNCNPNGSDYIWYFSDSMKEDMSEELVEKIESYDTKYKEYYDTHVSQLDSNLVNQYNALVTKYDDYYNTKSICLDCDTEGYFEEQCTNPNCNSKNILTGQKLQNIPTAITGYPALMTAYYNTIDLLLYLESGLMPNIELSSTTAEEQIKLLTTTSLSPVAVNVKELKNASEATAKSAVLSMAKVLIKPTYKVEVVDGSSSLSAYNNNSNYRTWTGKFIVTNYSDEEDTATSSAVSVRINNDTETFIKQKLDKSLNKENTDDYSITGLFKKEYNDFCNELKKYALNPLSSFSKSCDTCLSILHEQGASDKDKKPDLYESLYKPYFDKQQAINNEIKVRESEIAIIEGVWDKSDENNPECTTWGLQQHIEKCQKDIQEELNFEKYLGEDLWLEFCSYRRDDKYQNENYISDGLDNAELFKKANEFIEVAKEEIYKSAELQHSISATLNNLLSLPKFKPLIQYFKTGNWIRVQVDDRVYKLRLLEYDFNYSDSNTISVEFSDVTKIKNGTTDVRDVFEQASSMATSYGSVQRQAKKGNVARNTIDQWIVDGLDSASVQIKNNDSEEVILTESGLLARSYDDITGTYSPEQFKLTHNIMAYTDDNWETVSSALGKHEYTKWNNNQWVKDEDYGFTSKFVTAGYITGSQIIGGEIVSSNYKPKEIGTHINLLNGDFDFAGGRIVFDTNKDSLTLKNVTIEWANTNTPEVTVNDISGLDEYLDDINKDVTGAEESAKDYADSQDTILSNNLTQAYEQYTNSKVKDLDDAVAKHLGISGTTIINEKAVISPYLGGGYLNIVNTSNNKRVIIDPNNYTKSNYIFQVHNGSEISVGITSDGDAEFNGVIKAKKGGTIAGFNIGDTAIYNGTDSLTSVTSGIYLGTDGIRQYKSNEANVTISNGVLTTNGANISGTVTATNGTFNNGTIDNCTINNNCTIKGTLDGANGTFSGTVQGGSLFIGDINGTYAQITTDGKLVCNGADISGKTTTTTGVIGGWIIDSNSILSDRYTNNGTFLSGKNIAGMMSATDVFDNKINGKATTIDTNCQSLVSGSSPIRFIAGCIPTYHTETSTSTDPYITFSDNARFMVLDDGSLYASAAKLSDGCIIGDYKIQGGAMICDLGETDYWSQKDCLRFREHAAQESATYATYCGTIGLAVGTLDDDGTQTRIDLRSYQIQFQNSESTYSSYINWDTKNKFKINSKNGYLVGTWSSDSSITVTSDRNAKNSIKSIPETYEVVFNNLQSKIFKYNDGTSDRYHTGFVAQEVDDAITKAGLSRKDFAALCISDEGTEDERWGLRYSEFVSLNTWQIQKAKVRISILEEYVKTLESRILQLENNK